MPQCHTDGPLSPYNPCLWMSSLAHFSWFSSAPAPLERGPCGKQQVPVSGAHPSVCSIAFREASSQCLQRKSKWRTNGATWHFSTVILSPGCTPASPGHFKNIAIPGFPLQRFWFHWSGKVPALAPFRSSPGESNHVQSGFKRSRWF